MVSLVQPVVLAGGSGTRLWPVSTPERPKHLLSLVGPRTLLQQTLDRVADRELFSQPIIVCAARQADEIEACSPLTDLIVEPVARGSAAAIALAAERSGSGTMLLVLPSDHHIGDPVPLFEAVRRGLAAAEAGYLLTFGIRPRHAETGYGYITLGKPIGDGAFEAKEFIEKPDRDAAVKLIDSGSAYWNSGMFLFRADRFLSELDQHAPAIRSSVHASIAAASFSGRRTLPDRSALAACPTDSIDYAVMERCRRVAVVPTDLDWSDVGSWAAVYDLTVKDADGNAMSSQSMAIDSHGCLIRSTGPEVVAIGVDDLVIVATPDRILVVPRSEAQRVREAAERT